MRSGLIHPLKTLAGLSVALVMMLSGCNLQISNSASTSPLPPPSLEEHNSPTQAPLLSPTPVSEATTTPSPSPTIILTATITSTPTVTPTATITLTPTFDYPDVKVLMQANCRYGPGQAYLYSHGLYPGDRAEVHGRNYSGSWLWIQPINLDRHCWVSATVVEVTGDISALDVVRSKLPHSTLYEPPENVRADRDGDRVNVTWDPVWMTEDDYRGYLIEATICQGGGLVSIAVHTDETSYEFTDERSCSGESGGKLYTVEKHGYTDPVSIPWP